MLSRTRLLALFVALIAGLVWCSPAEAENIGKQGGGSGYSSKKDGKKRLVPRLGVKIIIDGSKLLNKSKKKPVKKAPVTSTTKKKIPASASTKKKSPASRPLPPDDDRKICGPDVTQAVIETLRKIKSDYQNLRDGET